MSPVVPTNPIKKIEHRWKDGLGWALLSPAFLGIIPIFAKLAYLTGAPVLTVIALRTIFAALILWCALLIFSPRAIFASPKMILGCLLAGSINGIGSIFYYTSLYLIDASVGQFVNISYLIFLTLFLRIAGQKISFLTIIRTLLAIVAIYILSNHGFDNTNWYGVSLMLIAAASYATQLFLSQKLLTDIPAETMTLYALTGMALIVSFAWLIFPPTTSISSAGWQPVLLMGFFTALSRLTLFLGVKYLGSIQTALLGISELLVTLFVARFWLEEYLTITQWFGGALLLISVLLVQFETNKPKLISSKGKTT